MSIAYSGMRAIEFSDEYGSFCGKILAGLGFEVIKLEKPEGSPERRRKPFIHDEPGAENSLHFAASNTGKKSVRLDLRSERGQLVFEKLIQSADVFIEACLEDAPEALSITWDRIHALNPRLMMVSISPFGRQGAYSKYRASSPMIPLASAGPMNETGRYGKEPLDCGHGLLDAGASMYAVVAILSFLYGRAHNGCEGAYIDISMQESGAAWRSQAFGHAQIPPVAREKRVGDFGFIVPGGVFPCKDGDVYFVPANKWDKATAWMKECGVDVLGYDDPKYFVDKGQNKLLRAEIGQVNELIAAFTRRFTQAELMREGQARGFPTGFIAEEDTLLSGIQSEARGYFVEIEHPVLGSLKYPGRPFIGDKTEYVCGVRSPLLGEHDREILASVGLSADGN